MKFKDYYEILGVKRNATEDEIKRAYRKLARKYHPDVSKEKDAEAHFKEMGEAYAVLKDPEKRVAYDQMGNQWQAGQDFKPPPNWDAGFEFSGGDSNSGGGADYSEFFEAIFGRQTNSHAGRGTGRAHRAEMHAQGQDHHAKVEIDLEDAYRGAERSITLRLPVLDAQGHVTTQERVLNVNIPKGVREGQHLRLSGQGGAGLGQGPAGDLYLEIVFRPHPLYRIDGRDIYLDLPLAPWEVALGATVTVPTPIDAVELSIPPGSTTGRKLRLKGKGIPGKPSGDFYAVLVLVLPPAITEPGQEAYRAMQKAFDFNPRKHLEG